MSNNQSQKFFLYARKSTDVEDKQILSIEAQITELRAFGKQNNLNIIDELVEKQSAKIPGRPIFGEMLKRIEKDEADGILAWHPDRLARNSVDGGQIIYLIDCGRIAALKFPQFWFEPTPQGKFMLNIAFGQSKYKNRKGFRTSAWPRAKRAETPKINGRRCAPPTKWLVKNQKVKSWSIFTISLEPTLSKIHRNFGVGGCGEEKGLGEKESPQPPPLFARLAK